MTDAATRSTDAELAALRAMGLKLPRGPRSERQAEPQEFLELYQHPTPEQLAAPALRDELVHATDRIIKFVLDVVGQALSKRGHDIDRRFPAADAAKVATLEGSVRELTGQVSDLTHEVARLKAARGVSDGQALAAAARRESCGGARPRKRPTVRRNDDRLGRASAGAREPPGPRRC